MVVSMGGDALRYQCLFILVFWRGEYRGAGRGKTVQRPRAFLLNLCVGFHAGRWHFRLPTCPACLLRLNALCPAMLLSAAQNRRRPRTSPRRGGGRT